MINVLFVRGSVGACAGTDSTHRPFRVAQSLLDDSVLAHLESSDRVDIETLQVDRQPYFPHGPFSTGRKTAGFKGSRTFAINFPILREAMHALTALLRGLIWAWRGRKRDRVIYMMTNFPPAAFAMKMVARMLGVPRVVTLTDLASFSYSLDRVNAAPWWKRPWMNAYARRVKLLEQSYDAYVLLTSQMGDVVNPSQRPHIVVEGVFNSAGLKLAEIERDTNHKAIGHAGTLDRLYGIGRLLDAFACIEDPDVELWLFGTGDMDDEIIERQHSDPRIAFHGFQPRTLVFDALQRATLLVNLRDPDDEYTKYSFPSKLFEYLASATPVATTSLSGIPQEYEKFLYQIDAISPDSTARALEEILALPNDELRDKGHRARQFVSSSKTAEFQCPRIEQMLVMIAMQGRAR